MKFCFYYFIEWFYLPDHFHRILYDPCSLPPANEFWGKVMFLHLFVILFTVATKAGGTHPTGMHTSNALFLYQK